MEDFGTNSSSLMYACATAFYNKNGLKKLVANAPANASPWIKTYLSPLAPYAKDFPEANVWSTLTVNRERGRALSFTFFARSQPDLKSGDKLDLDARDWIKSTGKAYMEFLDGNLSTVQAFPLSNVSPAD